MTDWVATRVFYISPNRRQNFNKRPARFPAREQENRVSRSDNEFQIMFNLTLIDMFTWNFD